MDKPLPQNIDAEKGLLGIIMERNDKLFEMMHIVAKEDFIEPFHGELYLLMRDMIETGKEAKPATMLHDLNQDADIGGITAAAYMHLLLREAPDGSMAITFARTIRDLAMRRKFIAVANKHLEEAYSAPATIGAIEIEARYHAAASSLFTTVQEAGMQPLGDLTGQVIKSVQDAYRNETRIGITSGLKAFDDLMGPLMGKRLYSISGASGSGKTALAWQIARNVAEAGHTVLFESIEMDGEELATRDLAASSGISSQKIERGDLQEAEILSLMDLQTRIPPALIVDSPKAPTVGSIRGKASRLKRLKGLKLIVIDHLRYIRSSVKGDLFEGMNDNLQALNAVADDLDVAIILLCQLRANYGSEPKVRPPNVGDIFNGAVIEQESDALLLVHREEYMLARRKPTEWKDLPDYEIALQKAKGKAELILQKRRGGAGWGTRLVGFDAPSTRFTDEIPRTDFNERLI